MTRDVQTSLPGSRTCPLVRPTPLLLLLAGAISAFAQEPESDDGTITLKSALVATPAGTFGRQLFVIDPIEHARLSGTLLSPRSDGLVWQGASVRWQTQQVGADGWLRGDSLRGGYVAWVVQSPREQVMLLTARGHSVAIVNGIVKAGDPYSKGWHELPVALKAGRNELWFQVGRGRLRAALRRPHSEVFLSDRDATVPHVVLGRPQSLWCALPLVNASSRHLTGLSIIASTPGGESVKTRVSDQLPFSLRKIPFQVVVRGERGTDGTESVELKLVQAGKDQPLDQMMLQLPVASRSDSHRRTFVSHIDGSVQYYGVTPALPSADADRPGLLLTLHGAGVNALRQARVYQPKSDLHVVAPTNRRPFGFDWEDWGRMDAMEVMKIARKEWNTDSRRTYVTGHSMGGHGAWHLAVTYPGEFAAVAPSAGWVSFWSYGGKRSVPQTAAGQLLRRSDNGSDTLLLTHNLRDLGVFVLHGDADRNVPISQARAMRGALSVFHTDFVYREKKGAGHWWGKQCCDWPALINFLQERKQPETPLRRLRFHTVNPSVSSRYHWAAIESQLRSLEVSSIDLRRRADAAELKGTTVNVQRLHLHLSEWAERAMRIELDGQILTEVNVPRTGELWLSRIGDKWQVSPRPQAVEKGPHRSGPFKQAFRNKVLFVYGTAGNDEENKWAQDKAQFDAETFCYRGNGAIEVIADKQLVLADTLDRNLILYGNAQTNAAWSQVVRDCPIEATQGRLTIGDRKLESDNLAFFFTFPRAHSSRALVACVGGTGIRGMRATTRSRYFVSGIGYPDFLVVDDSVFRKGIDAVRAIGFFDHRWQIAEKDIFFQR